MCILQALVTTRCIFREFARTRALAQHVTCVPGSRKGKVVHGKVLGGLMLGPKKITDRQNLVKFAGKLRDFFEDEQSKTIKTIIEAPAAFDNPRSIPDVHPLVPARICTD